jgi:tRNA A-37 threonylcarbamoyl transferase component Bud32
MAARHLEAAGLPVPRPLALAERSEGWGGVTAVYVAEWLPERRTLGDELLQTDGSHAGVRACALLTRLGALLRRMHASGYDHRDLHAGNILVGPDTGPGGPALHLIDLHRGRIGAPPGARRVRSALARLLAGLRALGVEGTPRRQALLTGYLGTGEPGAVAALDRSLDRGIETFLQHHQRRHDGDALREGPFFVRETILGRGFRRRGADADALEQVLRQHDAALAAGDGRVLKDGRKSAVTRHGTLVVKEARARGPWARFKRRLAPWRLAWGHTHAHSLERRGLGTALTYAYLHRDGRVFTVYQDLGAFPRLDRHAARLWREGTRSDQRALRDATAVWLAHLHRLGVYHGDVKGVNVLVGGTPAAPGLYVVDTDRCRFFRRPVDLGRRLRNLAQLAASIPVVVSRTERLRWWRRYTEELGLGDDLRRVASRVGVLVGRKLRVVDAPLE